MQPKLSDQAVSELPLSAARADLLEEIMSTPVVDDAPSPSSDRLPQRGQRWLAPIAVAATVAALATAPVWWPAGRAGTPEPVPAPAPIAPPVAPAPAPPPVPVLESGHLAVLDLPGWQVDNVEQDPRYGGSISYVNSELRLEVSWYPASSYADYVTDREHIVDPPAPGAPVEVLGAHGQLWDYSPDDHTVIREVQDGHWMEFRASGMDRAAYLALLDDLRLVGERDFEAALPASYATSEERDREVRRLLEEIAAVSGELLPPGSAPLTSPESDPYHLGADVAGGYACAWIHEYAAARAAGDSARSDEAVRVMGTSTTWPVLLEMNERGDYSEVVWSFADDLAEGRVPEGYRGALGC